MNGEIKYTPSAKANITKLMNDVHFDPVSVTSVVSHGKTSAKGYKHYRKEHNEIADAISQLSSLKSKDASDTVSTFSAMEATDSKIAKTYEV